MKSVPCGDRSSSEAPLGVLRRDEFQEHHWNLSPGDMVLCYSNTFAECKDVNGQTVGVPGLLARVEKMPANDPAEMVTRLAKDLGAENSENLCERDATAVLFRASNTQVGFKNNLLAPLRLLRSVTDSTRLG